ncbi:MAG: hypothetical protein Q8935_23925 [Bacillota bacterium]|nr:hypothetical protein [Bacillota bacterium]
MIVEPDSQTIRQYESVSDIEGHFSFKVENYYDTLKWLSSQSMVRFFNLSS